MQKLILIPIVLLSPVLLPVLALFLLLSCLLPTQQIAMLTGQTRQFATKVLASVQRRSDVVMNAPVVSVQGLTT